MHTEMQDYLAGNTQDQTNSDERRFYTEDPLEEV